MKTPHEFDYDLWTTGEGSSKQYWVRIKRTGKVTEASGDVMRFLRSEEKKKRREYELSVLADSENENARLRASIVSPLSLDSQTHGDDPSWLSDYGDATETALLGIIEKQFVESLTPRQRIVYEECLRGGTRLTVFAQQYGVSVPTVHETVQHIRKKAKKYFF